MPQRCDRNWLKPLFQAIQGTKHIMETHDYNYILPLPSSSKSKSLNYLTIIVHIIIILIVLFDIVYSNIFGFKYYFPLIIMPIYNKINTFLITSIIFIILLLTVHISIISPFLSPSKIKYTEKSYLIIIFKSFSFKTILFIILFSISPLLIIYYFLILFILGNTPTFLFKPNMKGKVC